MGKVGHRQAHTTQASHHVGRHSTHHLHQQLECNSRVREAIEIHLHDTVSQDPGLHINNLWISTAATSYMRYFTRVRNSP